MKLYCIFPEKWVHGANSQSVTFAYIFLLEVVFIFEVVLIFEIVFAFEVVFIFGVIFIFEVIFRRYPPNRQEKNKFLKFKVVLTFETVFF